MTGKDCNLYPLVVSDVSNPRASMRVSPSLADLRTSSPDIVYRSVCVNNSNWDLDARYRSPEYLTEGAYGEVVKAIDSRSKSVVVIKRIEILEKDNPGDWENSVRM